MFDGPNANPKVITLDENGSAVIVAVGRSSGLRDGRAGTDANGHLAAMPGGGDDFIYEVKSFHDNRIQIKHLRHNVGGLPHTEYVTIDNVRPVLAVYGPAQPLYVRRGVNVTFIFEFLDVDSGFTDEQEENTSPVLVSTPVLNHPDDDSVKLVVAGNVVGLQARQISKTDGGWRVKRSLSSTTIQKVAAHVPWYVVVADRAGNTRRIEGRIAGETARGGTDRSVVIDAFRSGLRENSFLGTEMQITHEGTTSEPQPIAAFTPGTGTIAVAEPFFADARGIGAGAAYEIIGAGLIVVDGEKPEAFSATTGTAYDTSANVELTGPGGLAKPTSLKVAFTDAAKSDDDAPGTGLDPASVTTAAFKVTDNVVDSVLVVGNDVYLTLEEPLRPMDEPKVTVGGGKLRDRAGNTVDKKELTSKDGLGPSLSLTSSDKIGSNEIEIVINTEEQLSDRPRLWVTRVSHDGAARYGGTAAAVSASFIRQAGVRNYTYTHKAQKGTFSVYAEGEDNQLNMSPVGDQETTLSTSAFTFEINSKLNNDGPPIVSVDHHEDVAEVGEESIEQSHTMIVRVRYGEEGNEYDRDGYATVQLTSLVIEHEGRDGTTSNHEYDVATEISTTDNVTFAVAVHEPAVGRYTLRVKAVDTAGNSEIAGKAEISVTWRVVPVPPFHIPLTPGWNLISLPFMPANPAIDGVVPPGHPIDAIVTYDSIHGIWLVSKRDPVHGRLIGDLNTMTPQTAYFVRTRSVLPLTVNRPPLTTHDDPPAPPIDLRVVKGWNLVPVVSQDIHVPYGIAADEYFGGLRDGARPGWVKALTFDQLTRRWVGVAPGQYVAVSPGGANPCTGEVVAKEDVEAGQESCQAGPYNERSPADSILPGNLLGEFDGVDSVILHAALSVGRGYWLYATVDGRIIP